MKKVIQTVLFQGVILVACHGQSDGSRTASGQLKIGDYLPDVGWKNVLNYPNGNLRLSDLKGKYVILDYWSKSCAACIEGFPNLERLQSNFKDVLQVVLITADPKEELRNLLTVSPILKSTKLPIVLRDTLLFKKHFIFRYVPFQVWIAPSGEISVMTDGWAATTENISAWMRGLPLQVSVRDDLSTDNTYLVELQKSSLLSLSNGKYKPLVKYYWKMSQDRAKNRKDSIVPDKNDEVEANDAYSIITTRFDDLNPPSSGLQLEDKERNVVGFTYLNKTVVDLFKIAYDYYPSIKKVIFGDDIDFAMPAVFDEFDFNYWYYKTAHCYQIRLPNYTPEYARYIMQQDLERFFGVRGFIEERSVKCMIFYNGENLQRLLEKRNSAIYSMNKSKLRLIEHTSEGYNFKDIPFEGFLTHILGVNNNLQNGHVIFDETTLEKRTTINWLLRIQDFNDVNLLDKELSRYGIRVREEMRSVKVLVLRKVHQISHN